MSTAKLESDRNCVVLGGLDGRRVVKALSALRSDLGRLETFVADLSDAVDVAPRPMVSIGHEVDRDAVVIDHLDERLREAISLLIDLRVMTRTARAAIQSAGFAGA